TSRIPLRTLSSRELDSSSRAGRIASVPRRPSTLRVTDVRPGGKGGKGSQPVHPLVQTNPAGRREGRPISSAGWVGGGGRAKLGSRTARNPPAQWPRPPSLEGQSCGLWEGAGRERRGERRAPSAVGGARTRTSPRDRRRPRCCLRRLAPPPGRGSRLRTADGDRIRGTGRGIRPSSPSGVARDESGSRTPPRRPSGASVRIHSSRAFSRDVTVPRESKGRARRIFDSRGLAALQSSRRGSREATCQPVLTTSRLRPHDAGMTSLGERDARSRAGQLGKFFGRSSRRASLARIGVYHRKSMAAVSEYRSNLNSSDGLGFRHLDEG
ncbi:hypothetical protein THAOC_18945, partial [Thalassiosira oceanica]